MCTPTGSSPTTGAGEPRAGFVVLQISSSSARRRICSNKPVLVSGTHSRRGLEEMVVRGKVTGRGWSLVLLPLGRVTRQKLEL